MLSKALPPASPSPLTSPIQEFSPKAVIICSLVLMAPIMYGFYCCLRDLKKRLDRMRDWFTSSRAAGSFSSYLTPNGREAPVYSSRRPKRLLTKANYCSGCVICLKGIKYSDFCRVLPICNHTFHAACIDQWMMYNKSCPICRCAI